MAMIIHMSVEGNTQGLISEACSPMEGREDTIHVMNMEYQAEIPWNEQDGRAQGHRIHHPIKLIKAIDRASPMLATALNSNELLTVTLQFYRYNPSGDGTEEQFYTITLEEANIVSIDLELPFTLAADSAKLPPMETLRLAFTKITATYEPDGIVTEDSWKVPHV
jgi:type VI secretion system secreted protein Hcp